jgi:hypothetical protein
MATKVVTLITRALNKRDKQQRGRYLVIIENRGNNGKNDNNTLNTFSLKHNIVNANRVLTR